MNELKRTNIGHYRNYRDVYFFKLVYFLAYGEAELLVYFIAGLRTF